jgi:hypothetical protein
MNAREYYASGSTRRSAQQPEKVIEHNEVARSDNKGNDAGASPARQDRQTGTVGVDDEELDSDSDSEDSSDEGGDDEDDCWLTGFVKGQLNGLDGEDGSQEEVDELEDE